LVIFAQFVPLRSIGANFDPAPIVEHPDPYDPLFMIGRSMVFGFLALFLPRDVLLPDHDRIAIPLFASDQTHH
jgi:hypothetical protein